MRNNEPMERMKMHVIFVFIHTCHMGLLSTVSCMFAFGRGRSSTPPCTHTESYACKQVHEGNISVMRGAKKHHCSVPTVNDRVAIFRTRCPCENRTKLDLENTPGYHSTKGCYDNLRFQGTSAGHVERSPHSAPCALCSWHGMQLFRVFFQKFSTELLTFSVILIEACMPGGGRVVDVGPAELPEDVGAK